MRIWLNQFSCLPSNLGRLSEDGINVVCLKVAMCLLMFKTILVQLGAQRWNSLNHRIERLIMENVTNSAKIQEIKN